LFVDDQLQEYKQYLELQLANVTQLLESVDKKSKRYIPLPVSSSLPDYVSSDFLISRLNASQKAETGRESNETGESEIATEHKKPEDNSPTKSVDPAATTESEKEESRSSDNSELVIVREEGSEDGKSKANNDSTLLKNKAFGVQTTHLTEPAQPEEDSFRRSFEPKVSFVDTITYIAAKPHF
jgi:hypothetical protein